jgi:3-oxoacyl-[acyl-carrier-protein] synthase-1
VNKAFVRATALASALAPDLDSAAARLSGEPAIPQRKAVEDWPYFAIPVEGDDWHRRAENIARSVAEDLRRRARLESAGWQALPCIVGSSSYSIGEGDRGGRASLDPPLEFCNKLAHCFGAGGPVMAVATACTSGLSALDIASGLIADGAFRDVLVLGVEFSNRFTVAGFAGLELLSRTGAKPCDRARDGLVLGEAFGAVLLSASPGAWRVEALACGMDAASLTGPAPGGEVIADTMRAAMTEAHWKPADVDLIKLQAGGSPASDLAEGRAVRRLFAPPPATVSLKGALGHTLGASGPAELALLLASLARGCVPPTWGFTESDDELGLTPSAGDATAAQRLLFNLSGFGGNVMTLALQRTG